MRFSLTFSEKISCMFVFNQFINNRPNTKTYHKMKKIKVSVVVILFVAISSIAFQACTKSEEEIPLENKNTTDLKLFLNQLYDTSELDMEVLKVEDKLTSSASFSLDLKQKSSKSVSAFSMVVDSKTDEGILEFNSFTLENYNSKSKTIQYTSYVNFINELGFNATYSIVLEKIDDKNYKIVGYNTISSNASTGLNAKTSGWWSRFGDCISGVLDTDRPLGRALAVAGIAGGAGCVPCGIAGAVVFGFAALGCGAV